MSKPVIYGQGNKRKSAAEDEEREAKCRRENDDRYHATARDLYYMSMNDRAKRRKGRVFGAEPPLVRTGIKSIDETINDFQLRQAARRAEAQRLQTETNAHEETPGAYTHPDKLYPKAYTHRDRPNPLHSVKAAVRMETSADMTFGWFAAASDNEEWKDDFEFLFTCDFGQHALPFVALTILGKKKMPDTRTMIQLEAEDPEQMTKATFVWDPSIFYETQTGDKKYQLDDCSWNALTKEHSESAFTAGLYRLTSNFDYTENHIGEEADESLVMFNFTGHCARIDSVVEASKMANHVVDHRWKGLFDYLLKGTDVTLSVFFHVPENYKLPSGRSPSGVEFVQYVTPVFQRLLDERPAPLKAYVDKDNTPAIPPDVPPAHKSSLSIHVGFPRREDMRPDLSKDFSPGVQDDERRQAEYQGITTIGERKPPTATTRRYTPSIGGPGSIFSDLYGPTVNERREAPRISGPTEIMLSLLNFKPDMDKQRGKKGPRRNTGTR
ncbi:hypothetical protein LTR67_003469 [Exophiala xenobiotica]